VQNSAISPSVVALAFRISHVGRMVVLQRQFPDSKHVFDTERGGPFTPDAVNRLIKRIGERAGFDFPVQPVQRLLAMTARRNRILNRLHRLF
jgi:hypothetical protein